MAVELKKADKYDILFHVRRAFEGDSELLTQYHISPGTLDHCVNNTLQAIYANQEEYKDDMEMYRVSIGYENIGYTIIIRNKEGIDELYSFGINIKYRTPDLLKEWMAAIKEKMTKEFYLVLWSKNTRAINFFKKNGAEIRDVKELEGTEKTVLTLKL